MTLGRQAEKAASTPSAEARSALLQQMYVSGKQAAGAKGSPFPSIGQAIVTSVLKLNSSTKPFEMSRSVCFARAM